MAIMLADETLFLNVCSETNPKTLEQIRKDVLSTYNVSMSPQKSVEVAEKLERDGLVTSNYVTDQTNTKQGRRTIRTVRKCSSGKTLTF